MIIPYDASRSCSEGTLALGQVGKAEIAGLQGTLHRIEKSQNTNGSGDVLAVARWLTVHTVTDSSSLR